jgi:hypothetical protein
LVTTEDLFPKEYGEKGSISRRSIHMRGQKLNKIKEFYISH